MEAKPRLLDTVRAKIRALHYSYLTEQQYVQWIKRHVHFSVSGIRKDWVRRTSKRS